MTGRDKWLKKEYLLPTQTLVKRSEEQIVFSTIAGRENHQKRKVHNLPKREAIFTPWSHDNLEVQREFSLKALQNTRLARLIEEAHWQDTSLSISMLCLF